MDYENILMALKNGNVPESGVKELCIGREKQVNEFEKLLDKVDNKKAIVNTNMYRIFLVFFIVFPLSFFS